MTTDTAAAPPVRRGRTTVVVATVVLVIAAAATWFVVLGGPAGEVSDDLPGDGAIVALEPQTTTLGRAGLHHARVALALVLAEGTDPQAITDRAPLLQDALLRELATMDADTVRSTEGSDTLRSHLTDRAQTIWADGAVRRVVLTELVVQ